MKWQFISEMRGDTSLLTRRSLEVELEWWCLDFTGTL